MLKSILVGCASFLSVFFVLYCFMYMSLQREPNETVFSHFSDSWSYDERSLDAILLWWTPFMTQQRLKMCGSRKCLFTANRSYMAHPKLKGLMFYGTSITGYDMPPRGHLLWGLFHEESPRNVAVLSHDAALSLFNYSATFSRASHLPLTLQSLPSLDLLISKKYYKSYEVKEQYRESLAPVMYLQTDCSTPNDRDSYVAELMKYIPVDSFGTCLHNRDLPASLLNNIDTMMSDEMLNLTSHYKFAIAFENAICEDYITEKLWRPLIAGTVPIYVGSPSIRDWLPNDNSAILAMNFSSPQSLAEHLLFLDSNKPAYESYLTHKSENDITNERLVRHFNQAWADNYFAVIDDFECLFCGKLFSPETSVLNKSHYNCPEPRSILSGKPNESNWWYQDYLLAACEAEAFKDFLLKKRWGEKFNFDSSACEKR